MSFAKDLRDPSSQGRNPIPRIPRVSIIVEQHKRQISAMKMKGWEGKPFFFCITATKRSAYDGVAVVETGASKH